MISRGRPRYLVLGVALVAFSAACSTPVPSPGPTVTASPGPESSTAPSATWSALPTSGRVTATGPSRGPGTGATLDAVVHWIDAGRQVDDAGFHTANDWRTPGTTTRTGSTLFRLPVPMPARSAGGCGISEYRLAALSCLPGIDRGVPRPDGLTGQWIGSWVDFTGTAVTVGSLHGDPGVFNNGVGEPVPYGTAVTSGDYRCRPAEEGMYCRSLRHRSAVLMGRAFAAYGCREVPPEWGVGRQYTCG